MKVALAGDTMLGRKVAERLAVVSPTASTAFGTEVEQRGGRLVVEFEPPMRRTSSTTNDEVTR